MRAGAPAALGTLLLLAGAAEAQPHSGPRYEGWSWAERPLPAPPAADTLEAPPDRWLGPDKAYHAGASFALTLAMQGVLTANGASGEDALPVAAGATLALGVMKEVADAGRPRNPLFSWRDLTADALGVLLAVGVASL